MAARRQHHTALCWTSNHIRCDIALAEGKKQHDKRASERERDWREAQTRYLERSA